MLTLPIGSSLFPSVVSWCVWMWVCKPALNFSPFALLSACNWSRVVSGCPGRGEHHYCYFTRGTEVQRSKPLEEVGTGIWTPVVWLLQDFFLFPSFVITAFPILLLQVFLPLIFSSLIFSLMHLANFLTYFSTHSLRNCCLSFFLFSHAGSTSQICSPSIAALWLFLGYAVCCDNVSFFFLNFIVAWQTGEVSSKETEEGKRKEKHGSDNPQETVFEWPAFHKL